MDKNNFHIIEIAANQNVKDVLNEYLVNNGIQRGYILNAIGSLLKCKLNNPQNKVFPIEVKLSVYSEPMEIISFSGEVFPSCELEENLKKVYENTNDLFLHIHTGVALNDSKVVGGGLVDAQVFRNLKIFFLEVK